jgi:hypothetical protein
MLKEVVVVVVVRSLQIPQPLMLFMHMYSKETVSNTLKNRRPV